MARHLVRHLDRQFQDNSEPGKGAQDSRACSASGAGRSSTFRIACRSSALVDARRSAAAMTGLPRRWCADGSSRGVLTAQSGRPFSVWNGAALRARAATTTPTAAAARSAADFTTGPWRPPRQLRVRSGRPDDFLNGLFNPAIFQKPAPGTNGTLGRNTFRGPGYRTLDLSLTRSFPARVEPRTAAARGRLQRAQRPESVSAER